MMRFREMNRSDSAKDSGGGEQGANADPPVEPQRDGLVGKVLSGTYKIIAALDEGGMGKLYRAEHQRLHRQVAVKVLASALSGNQEALLRFRREADIISQLDHPHIVRILDFDTTESGDPYIVMELLSGMSLAQRLSAIPIMPLRDTTIIVSQIAGALTAAHRGGVVHRDLKPDNVFLVSMRDGSIFVKLLDFGISRGNEASKRFTGKYDILGTPEYMAPEQALATAKADHRADQWSLACISYEMLTGHVPFAAENAVHVLAKIVNEAAPPLKTHVPSIHESIERVVLRGLAKDPNQRFSTIGEYAAQLASAADSTLPSEPELVLPHTPRMSPQAATAPTLGAQPHKRTTKPERRVPSAEMKQALAPPSNAAPVPATVAPFDAVIGPSKRPAPRAPMPSSPFAGEDSVRFESGRIRRPHAVTPQNPALPVTKPNTNTNGHSPLPARPSMKLEAVVDEIKRASSEPNLALAVRRARLALGSIQLEPSNTQHPRATEALRMLETLFLRALGGKHKKVCLSGAPSGTRSSLNPTQMFLLSRIEGTTTIEELLDISPLSKVETLDILLSFNDQGLLNIQ